MRIAYSPAAKMEAVALAAVVGAEQAALQLGMGARAIRAWQVAAGHPPELDGDPDDWTALRDLAVARTTAALAGGKLTAIQVATIGAIATRNMRPAKVAPPATVNPIGDTTLVDAAVARLMGWLDGLPTDDRRRAVALAHYSLADELARRAETPGAQPPFDTPDQTVADGLDALLAYVQHQLPTAAAWLADRDALTAARNAQRRMASTHLSDGVADLLIAAEARMLLEEPHA